MAERFRSYHVSSIAIHLFGISILSYLLSRRAPSLKKPSEWMNWTWGKLCMFLVLLDIWLFLFISAVLLHGVRSTWDPIACEAVIVTCIFFQGSSKVLIAAFLVEKMYIVWSKGRSTPRLKTRTYQVGLTLILGYIAADVLFFLGRKSSIREDGECVLAYKTYTTITLMAYEGFQDLFFTLMFVWPLKSGVISPRLHIVARKSFYGAVGSLAISLTTTIVVIMLSNSGVGWICMNACMIDATLNATILYWVSSGAPSDSVKQFSIPEIPVTVKTKATTAITSTIRFMGLTDSHHTISTASRDPEQGLGTGIVSKLNVQPPFAQVQGTATGTVGIRSRRHSF